MKEITLSSLLATILFAVISPGQTVIVASPAEPGMYVEVSGGLTKVMGQIAEFKRSGSLFVSDVTIGIKTRKQNIQLLGPHAQTVVSAQPVFYFMPAKQEAEAGVNGGWPTFDFCVRYSHRGCPILAVFARVGGDAACAI